MIDHEFVLGAARDRRLRDFERVDDRHHAAVLVTEQAPHDACWLAPLYGLHPRPIMMGRNSTNGEGGRR